MKKATVLIIGADGILGSIIANEFEIQQWDVRRGSRSHSRHSAVYVDLHNEESVIRASIGCDLVVNTVPDPRFSVEKMVARRGGLVVTTSIADPWALRGLRARNSQARGTVIVNAGLGPGVTTLVAADLIRTYPFADNIEIALTLSSKGTCGRAGVEFVHRSLTQSGRHRSTSGRHYTRVIPFPEPVGPRLCFEFAEREDGWIGDLANGRRVHTYGCMDGKALHATVLGLNRIGLLGRLPRRPFNHGCHGGPVYPSSEQVAHWVAVKEHDNVIAARTVECRGIYKSAAQAAALLGRELVTRHRDGKLVQTGFLRPDEVFGLVDLKNSLESNGIKVTEQEVAASQLVSSIDPPDARSTN